MPYVFGLQIAVMRAPFNFFVNDSTPSVVFVKEGILHTSTTHRTTTIILEVSHIQVINLLTNNQDGTFDKEAEIDSRIGGINVYRYGHSKV